MSATLSPWVIRLALPMLIEEPPLSLGDSELAKQLLPHEEDRLQRGRLLKQALRETIISLKPVETVAAADPRQWPYLIYVGEYLEGRTRTAMEEALAIGRVTYTRAKRRGLDWIAGYLPYAVKQDRERTVGDK